MRKEGRRRQDKCSARVAIFGSLRVRPLPTNRIQNVAIEKLREASIRVLLALIVWTTATTSQMRGAGSLNGANGE